MTHWIEIKPGVRFQVSGRVKQSAGMRRMAQYHHQGLSDAERRRGFSHALGGERAPLNKYSIALLDEAVALAMEIGVKGAVLKTGVKYWSIVQRKRILYLRAKRSGRIPEAHWQNGPNTRRNRKDAVCKSPRSSWPREKPRMRHLIMRPE